MATATLISLEEYLQTSYRPDREYIDGELRERNVGKWEHARLQALLADWFVLHESEWNVMAATGLRTRVAATRVRIPDVLIVAAGPQPDVITGPPVLVIEILSPDDTYTDTQQRCQDYQRMGVQAIWIIDPKTRTGRLCVGATWSASPRLEVPGTAIYVELDALFARLGESRAALGI